MKNMQSPPTICPGGSSGPAAPFGGIRRILFGALAALGLAASVSVQAQSFTPIPLSSNSFNVDVVIPTNWTYRLNAQSVTVTIDHGPCLQTNNGAGYPLYYSVDSGDTFFETGLNRTNSGGLPHGGSQLTGTAFSSHVYQLPYWTNFSSNCVCICPYTNGFIYNNQPLAGGPYTYPVSNPYYNPHLTLNNSTPYNALSFLCTGGGPHTEYLTVQYADGSTQGPVVFEVPNWFVNANTYYNSSVPAAPVCSYVYSATCRCNPSENNNNFDANPNTSSGSRLWAFDISLSNTNSAATNVIFNCGYSQAANGNTSSDVIIGVSGSSNFNDGTNTANTNVLTGPFSPIPVSGFNAGFVVANSPQTLAGLAPLNATMDNGTNIGSGGNTWFEQGWDAASTNGFPAHGSLLTSAANPTRTYQMASNYFGNMCTLVDSNHRLVNITPATPGSYTAFSLLTCGASIGAANTMTNYIILQHSDGVNESNIFYGYDWFNNTLPYAYSANERVNIGSTSSETGREVQNLNTGDPRMFESEFQMQDGSAVTNIELGFLTGAGNWATYVLAVSASTNILPIANVITYTPAQNVYAGQTATFGISPGIGSFPQYQWQYTDGATFTNILSNGASTVPGSTATISGATTTNLVISNVGPSDAAYQYTCQIYNSFPSTNYSPLAVLSLRLSTNQNITSTGDQISDFGEGSLPSPVGLGVGNVLDGTLNAYLNYGANASTTGPFAGPVGIILTPLEGSTVVNALVFYNAVNAPVCDPADFMLEGSTDGGNTWTTIVPDQLLNLPVERNLSTTFTCNITNQVLQEVDFANTNAYTTYRVTVENVRSNSVANSMQIAEIQFLGAQQPVAPGIFVQPTPASKTLIAGGNYITTPVVPSGPGPFSYQWYDVLGGATNGIAGATNASLTITNIPLSAADSSYFCVVSNTYGGTATTNLTLAVITAGSTYASTIVADSPLAYWRLDEGNGSSQQEAEPNGLVVANDYMGSLSGLYTNAVIGVDPGYSTNDTDTAAGFGIEYVVNQDSYAGRVPNFNNFVAPTNHPAAFSVEAWVQGSGAVAQSIAGAGIVTYGYGGGGEQFALDCGGTGNNFRFYFRDATLHTNATASGANPSHTVNAPASGTGDGLWHHVVGVLNSQNSSNNAEYLYVDGALVATTQLGTNLLGVQMGGTNLSIGARSSASTTNMNLQFNGSVDEVAIYPYALSSAQVLNHYYAAGVGPRFTVQPTNTLVPQGSTASFVTTVLGTPAMSLQWYQTPASNNVTVALAGQTNATLVLSNVVQDSYGPDSFYLMASNQYAAVSSTVVQLTVVGAPEIFQDLPQSLSVLVGSSFSLSAVLGGTQPITYGWQYNSATTVVNGGRVSGAQSSVLTITNVQFSDSGTYQLFATNAYGTVSSQIATVTVVPAIGFNGTGSGWSANGVASYGGGSNLLTLTTSGNQSASSFFLNKAYVGAFQASWTYQDINPNGPDSGADGTCFVIQNAASGINAVGGGGGALGVSGISPSYELEFNIYANNAYGGIGYGFATNGALAYALTSYPIDVADQNPIYVQLDYADGEASLTLMETNGAGGDYIFQKTIPVNIPLLVGANTAYVGFTGATGGSSSQQTISDFNFVSWPPLSVTPGTGGTLVLSWPQGVGGYVLQQASSLTSGTWTTVSGTVTQTGTVNEMTVSASGGQTFYRLQLNYTPQ